MALTIRICVLKRGKWCLVAKGLVKRLQSGDVRENEYRETDDLTTRYLNKEQQFSRGVLLIVRATARARGIPTTPSQRRRLRFRDADREKLCPTSLKQRERRI